MPALRLTLAAGSLALITAFAVACGDDSNDSAEESPAAPTQSAMTPEAGGDDGGGGNDLGVTLANSRLKIEAVEGLEGPTHIVFLADNDMLVSQKNGSVVRVTDGEVAGPVLELAANYADERGVLGLALHPQFEQNNYVYIYWTWTGEGTAPEGLLGEAFDDIELVPANGNRIDRFLWDGSQLTFDRNIIEMPSLITDLTLDRRRGNHNGGVIDFGPDGKLYAVIGDQNVRGALTNVVNGPGIADSGIVAAVVRLNDDGTTPEDNPFAAEGGDTAKIYAYGIRNSFGFDFHPTGSLWLEVNGQASFDEIVNLTPGANLGWIQIMGPPERFDEYKQLEIDTERKLDNPSFPPEELAASSEEALQRMFLLPGAAYREPAFAWKYAPAPAGLHVIQGTSLGDDYEGDILVGDVNTGSIWHFDVAADGSSLVLEGPLADGVNDNTTDDLIGEMADSLFGEGFLVVTDIETAPDGSLWIVSNATGTLYHITAE